MGTPTLFIGHQKYSGWSMRPFLLLRTLGVPFEMEELPIYDPRAAVAWPTPSLASKLVPQLVVDGSCRMWDSLAICEYVAESEPRAWPEAPAARAVARSVCSEIHSGLASLKREMPFNAGRSGARGFCPSEGAAADIARVMEMWRMCRETYGARASGPWLFGRYSVADAFSSPLAVRFAGYGVAVGGESARAYFDHVMADEHVQEWLRVGRAGKGTVYVPEYEQ
jgi:glutathione S-transferase